MPIEPSATPRHVLTVSQENWDLTYEENNWDLTLTYTEGNSIDITNALVNSAIEDNPSATGASLGLGTAAYTSSSAYAPASHTHPYVPRAIGLLYGNGTVGVVRLHSSETLNGKPYYSETSTRYAKWVTPEAGASYWEVRNGGTTIFRAVDSAFTPDLVSNSNWVQVSGAATTIEVVNADIVTTNSVIAAAKTTFADIAHVHTWDDIQDKPTDFPPSEHTQTASTITDFAEAVAAAAPNTITSATTTDFAAGTVLVSDGTNVSSLAYDVAITGDTIAKRDGSGNLFASTFVSAVGGGFVFNDSLANPLYLTIGTLTDERSIQFPDASGTVALTEDYTSGTATIDILNATVQGTLMASHIHGNLAGSVYAHVRAGETLAKGDPVYISGSHGSGASLIAIVSKADASNAAKMPAVGVMDAAVAHNSNGHMVITGTITDLNTNAYAVNAELYVAAGGGFTSTPPTTLCQPVARVERSNTNNGAVIVKVNGLSSKSAIDNTLVRRGVNGDASFSTSANDTVTLNLESNGDFVGTLYPSAVYAAASGLNGIGANVYSDSGLGAVITSNTNTGAVISTNSGTYHVDFGSGNNRSAIERVRGWFVWFYNSFIGRLKTANITANRDWTLPDKSGTIFLDADLGTNVATFLATPSSANLAAAITDETGTGSLVFATSPTITSPTINTGISGSAVPSLLQNRAGSTRPICVLFEDFLGLSGAGTHPWNDSGTGSTDALSTGGAANFMGTCRIVTGTTSGNVRVRSLGVSLSNIFVGAIVRYGFAIPDITTVTVAIGFAGGGSVCQLLYAAANNSGQWTLNTNAGVSTFTTATPQAGNYISGKRYQVELERVSATQTRILLEIADFNLANWSTVFSGTVTHASVSGNWGECTPSFNVTTQTNAARSLVVDWASLHLPMILR